MRVAQLWHWIYLRGATYFDEMTNVGKELRAALADAFTLARPEVVSEQVSKDGTRKWLIRMAPDRPARQGRGDRVRLHPRDRPRHALRLEPGRLHAHLLLLPYGHAAPRAQPDLGRDRRRSSSSPATGSATGPTRRRRARASCPTTAALRLQHRVHGHGRAALQSRQRRRRHRRHVRRRGPHPLAPTHHASRPPASCRRSSASAQRGDTMLAISLHAVRDELRDELVPLNRKYAIASCSMPAAPIPACPMRGASPSNT